MSELSTIIFGQAVDFTAQSPDTISPEAFDVFIKQADRISDLKLIS